MLYLIADMEEETAVTHLEVMDIIKDRLKELLKDPFLTDISLDVSPEEVKSRLAVEQGRAITVHIRRFDDAIIR